MDVASLADFLTKNSLYLYDAEVKISLSHRMYHYNMLIFRYLFLTKNLLFRYFLVKT